MDAENLGGDTDTVSCILGPDGCGDDSKAVYDDERVNTRTGTGWVGYESTAALKETELSGSCTNTENWSLDNDGRDGDSNAGGEAEGGNTRTCTFGVEYEDIVTRMDAEPLGGYADTVGYNLDTVDCGGDFTTVREADGSNTSTYTCKGGYDDIATMKYAEFP